MSEYVDKIRVDWAKSDAERDAGLTTPSDITRIDNISYGPYGTENLMDIYYLTSSKEKKNPVIVSVHGGGYVYGNKEVYQFYLMSLAQRGFTVVNFNYRLAPETRFPGCLEDTNAVMEYILAHKDEYPMDLNNIFMVGDSAGAHMAALYSCLATNSEYADIVGIHPKKELTPKAVALNCGVYDIDQLIEKNGDPLNMAELFGEDWKKKYRRFLDTKSYVTRDFPPTFIMSAECDFLKFELPQMAECLRNAGVTVKDKIYGDVNAPEIAHVFHCNMHFDEAKLCNDEECEFFREYIN